MPFYDEEDELSEESFKQILHIHTIFAALTNFSSYLCSADSCDIILKNKLNYRPQKGLGGLCLKAWELELVEDSLKTYRTICWLTLIDVTLFNFKAHQQSRKADRLLAAGKYEEAISCHRKAAGE